MSDLDDCFDHWGDAESEWQDDEPKLVSCKYCQTENLVWEEARGEHNEKRWVLMTYFGEPHACRAFPQQLSPDQVKDLFADV